MAASVLLLLLGVLSFGAIPFTKADVEVLIDAYPNTPQVSQSTTVIMVCHVSGVSSDTTVTYQWSCPNYGCGARGLQCDGNIVSRREEGNMIVIDVVNDTDSGDYMCNVRSSGTVLGTVTYRIDYVSPAIVWTGSGGMIPLHGFAVDGSKPNISTPFGGTTGNYIRCVWPGRQLEWHRSNIRLQTTSAGNNEYFFQAIDTAELWQSTQTPGPNEEYGCRENGSTDITYLIGLFFRTSSGSIGQPAVNVASISTTSIELFWLQNINNGRYFIKYERIDLPILVTHHFIKKVYYVTSVVIPNLIPGATYKIQVWSSPTIFGIGPPYKVIITTKEETPTAPRLLTIVRSTSTSVVLNWIPPRNANGVIHYEIEYSTSKSFVESTTINTASNSTYHTVPDVPEFPRHYFRVVAVNSAGVGKSSSSNIVGICLGTEVDPSPPTEVIVDGINTTCISVVSWNPPTRGALGCSGGVTYIVTVSTSTGGVIVQNGTSTNTTVNVCSSAVTAVIVMAMNSIGSSKPNVWTVPTMKHDAPTDSNGSIVAAFFGGFSVATGMATVVFILVFCNMKRKIDKLEKNSNKSPVQPEESQYTEIELKFNPSYQSVEVKPDKQNEVYEAVDPNY